MTLSIQSHGPRRPLPFVLLALALPGLAACREAEAPPRHPEPVTTSRVEAQAVSRAVELTGSVRARVSSELSFRVAGRIEARNVDVGARVRKGDVLATLAPEEQEADLSAARAALLSSEAALTQARSNFERQKTLIASGSTTRGTYDDAQESLSTAQSENATATANLANAEEQLSFTVLRADADGVITARSAEAGQVVDVAQAVYTLAHDGPRDVVFDVQESAVTRGWAEGRVAIRSLSDPELALEARVREIAPAVDASTGSVRVIASVADDRGRLALGSAVSGRAALPAAPRFVLPWTAIAADAGRSAVWVVDPASRKVALRPVTVEQYRTGEVIVAEGLENGDEVVARGGQLLREGEAVEPRAGDRP